MNILDANIGSAKDNMSSPVHIENFYEHELHEFHELTFDQQRALQEQRFYF